MLRTSQEIVEDGGSEGSSLLGMLSFSWKSTSAEDATGPFQRDYRLLSAERLIDSSLQ
jgi:hypothetical protein